MIISPRKKLTTHRMLVERLQTRIQMKQQRALPKPTFVQQFFKWLEGPPMPRITPVSRPAKTHVYVAAYCHRCQDYYDSEFGCMCFQVHPQLPPIQDKIVYAELADSPTQNY
jgi:hypothetical protein